MKVIMRTYQPTEPGTTRIADGTEFLYPLNTPISKLLSDREADKEDYHFSLADISDSVLCAGLTQATNRGLYTKWQANISSRILENALPPLSPGHVRVILATNLSEISSPFLRDQDPQVVLFPLDNSVQDLLSHREVMRQYLTVYFYVGEIASAHLFQGLTAASVGDVHTKWEVKIHATLLPL